MIGRVSLWTKDPFYYQSIRTKQLFSISCLCTISPTTIGPFLLVQMNSKTMVCSQNYSQWDESVFLLILLTPLTMRDFQHKSPSKTFKVDPLTLLNYKYSLAWSALLSSRDCVRGSHTSESQNCVSRKLPLMWRTLLLCPPRCFPTEWINSIFFIFPLGLSFPCLYHFCLCMKNAEIKVL